MNKSQAEVAPAKRGQHTPGPWHTESNQFAVWDDKHAIAAVYGTMAPEPMCSEARANALLIAAVPELLAACREALAVLQFNCDCGECGPCRLQNQIKLAIAKAEGREV